MKKKTSSPQPVQGTTLVNFAMKKGIVLTQACDLFGISRSKWDAMGASNKPVDDVTLAILYRAYASHPDLIENKIDIKKFYTELTAARPINSLAFSVIMGRGKAAASRWMNRTGSAGATVNNLVSHAFKIREKLILNKIREDISRLESAVKKKNFAAIKDIAAALASQSRNISDQYSQSVDVFRVIESFSDEEARARGLRPLDNLSWTSAKKK